jgi:hypothetical protein
MARPYHPVPPFQAPLSGTLEERLANMATEINRKADQGVQGTAYRFMALTDPSGQTWRIEITTGGVLVTTLVPRT